MLKIIRYCIHEQEKIIFQAGFAFLEAGSVRSKNTTNILIKNYSELVIGEKFIKIILTIPLNKNSKKKLDSSLKQ